MYGKYPLIYADFLTSDFHLHKQICILPNVVCTLFLSIYSIKNTTNNYIIMIKHRPLLSQIFRKEHRCIYTLFTHIHDFCRQSNPTEATV